MNWNEIATNNPTAFEQWCEYHFIYKAPKPLYYFSVVRQETLLADLFNFFDSKGILVWINPVKSFGDSIEWKYSISTNERTVELSVFDLAQARTDAHIAGFTQAFAILERQLTNNPH